MIDSSKSEGNEARFRQNFQSSLRMRRVRGERVTKTRGNRVIGRGGDEEGSVEQVARTNRYVGGNEYFTINFARFHCSNCEHFRPAGAKPQGVTINYDGVMPQSIYYAAHRMPPQMIPTCLHARALCRRPSASLRFRCVTG